jgi:hypothetical protein
MMFKVLAIKNVMKRNKESHNIVPAGSQPETIKAVVQLKNSSRKHQETQKVDVDEDKTIKFPFIMVPSQAQGSVRTCFKN